MGRTKDRPVGARRRGDSHILRWAEKISWKKRVRAVCKPCWEVRYCPYGPLVEQFPLRTKRDERSCRIFGHDCPVFHVAEPLTETKQLRNISRTIPRVTQFRVLKRENQICAGCNQPVRTEDIEFDHIIPWTKGGSSDDANIRLLCRVCNRKRRAEFEQEFLVESVRDHLVEPMGAEVVGLLIQIALFGKNFELANERAPSELDYAQEFSRGKIGDMDRMAAACYGMLKEFFSNTRPLDLSSRVFQALKMRWATPGAQVLKIKNVAAETAISAEEIIQGERDLLRRLGFMIRSDAATEKKWMRM